jgi:hypothetical protein
MFESQETISTPQSVWNSLEIIKLVVGTVIPIIVGVLVWKLNEAIKRFEHRQWRNQKLIEKRLEIYDKIAPQLNDLLCYFTYVGCWKDLTPDEVVKMKRLLDKEIYLAMPMFSTAFSSSCMEFMNLCYETYSGWGEDAKLKADFERRKEAYKDWRVSWELKFSKNVTDPNKIRESYRSIMDCFSQEIGFVEDKEILPLGRLPSNIK